MAPKAAHRNDGATLGEGAIFRGAKAVSSRKKGVLLTIRTTPLGTETCLSGRR